MEYRAEGPFLIPPVHCKVRRTPAGGELVAGPRRQGVCRPVVLFPVFLSGVVMFSGMRLLQMSYVTVLALVTCLLALPGTSDAQGFRGTAGMPPPPVALPVINNLGIVGFPVVLNPG